MENEHKENKDIKKNGENDAAGEAEDHACECGDECACHQKEASELERELEEYKNLSTEYLNGWKRAKADYLNFRNEEADRIAGLIRITQEEMVSEILPVLDNFNLVVKAIPDDKKEDANVEGVVRIKTQLESLLKSYGVEEIKAEGEKFDPMVHEAVQQVDGKEIGPGIVAEVVKKGYTINGRVLRAAKVKVAK